MTRVADELSELAGIVARLSPDWRNPEQFFEARSEIAHILRRSARILNTTTGNAVTELTREQVLEMTDAEFEKALKDRSAASRKAANERTKTANQRWLETKYGPSK